MPRRGTAHKRSDKALAPRLVKRLNIAITTATRSCSCPGWRACSCTIQDFNPEDIKDDSAPTVNEEKEPDIAFVASHITAGSVEARSSTVVKEEPKQLTYANESDRLSAEVPGKNTEHGVTEVELTEDELEPEDVPAGRSPSRPSEVSKESSVAERVQLKPGPGAHTSRRSRSRSRFSDTSISREIPPWRRGRYGLQPKAASSRRHWPDVRERRR